MARGVGREAEGGPLDGHGGVGQVFARAGVDDVARDVGVARPAGTRGVLVGAQRRGDGEEQQEQCSRKVSFHVGLFRWVVNSQLHAPQGCGTAVRRGGAARKRGARRVRCVRKVHPDARDMHTRMHGTCTGCQGMHGACAEHVVRGMHGVRRHRGRDAPLRRRGRSWFRGREGPGAGSSASAQRSGVRGGAVRRGRCALRGGGPGLRASRGP